jgi:hypothetical protein
MLLSGKHLDGSVHNFIVKLKVLYRSADVVLGDLTGSGGVCLCSRKDKEGSPRVRNG